MNPLAINSSIQCREAFVKSSAPCAFDPIYTYPTTTPTTPTSSWRGTASPTNSNFKKHLFFLLQHRGMTPAAFLQQQAALPGGGTLVVNRILLHKIRL